MPLGSRDILMIIRARDLASRTLRGVGTTFGNLGSDAGRLQQKLFNVGSALTTLGVGIGAAGVVGLKFFKDAADAAAEYNNESRLTLTQVDEIGVSLEDIKRIGRDVALAIPAPFEQMQKSLYDIFSSMDVNVGGAEHLLTEFSRAAVAGQVDIQDAARGTIGILNAYSMGAEGVNHINDVMFQLVRKGVGTYAEFAAVIGLSTPAAVRAGQSFETLAGMMAFLTRNGMSASTAAAAAGRALENLTRPKVMERLEEMGVSIKNAAGEYRPMVDIVGDLAKKFEGLTKPEIATALEGIFKSAGNNVQARRFWSLAIEDFDAFQEMVAHMGNSAGELDKAYGLMFDSPQAKMQSLKNHYEVLRTEIGDQVLPIMLELAKVALAILKAWNSLSDESKRLIVWIGMASAAFATILGIVLTLGGAFAMLIATIMSMGVGFGAAIGIIGGVAAALALIPVAVYLIIRYWDELVGIAKSVWQWFNNLNDIVKLLIQSFVLSLLPISGLTALLISAGILIYKNWDTIKAVFIELWHVLQDFGKAAWKVIKEGAGEAWQVMQAFWDWLSSVGVAVWQAIAGAAADAWGVILDIVAAIVGAFQDAYNWIDKHFGEGIARVWNSLAEGVAGVWNEIVETIIDHINRIERGFGIVKNVVLFTVKLFAALVRGIAPSLGGLLGLVTAFAAGFVRIFGPPIVAVVKELIDVFKVLLSFWTNIFWPQVEFFLNILAIGFETAFKVIMSIVEFFVSAFMAFWDRFGENILNSIKITWDFVSKLVESAMTIISNIIQFALNIIQGDWGEAWDNIKNVFGAAWDAMWAALQYVWDIMVEFFTNVGPNIIGFIGDMASLLWQTGWDILNSMWEGIWEVWLKVVSFFVALPGYLKDFFVDAGEWLVDAGIAIIQGLVDGIAAGPDVWSAIKKKAGSFLDPFLPDLPNVGDMLKGLHLGGRGADGGIFDRPTRMTIGEAGREVLLPLSDMQRTMRLIKESGLWSKLQPYMMNHVGSMGAGNGASVYNGQTGGIYIAHAVFGDEKVVEDLDWWTRTQTAGV